MRYLARSALMPDGWHDSVLIETDPSGAIAAATPGADPAGAETLSGPVVPGIANLHSHAFQRAMAGLAETRSGEDHFWGWREVMYRFLTRLTPDDVQAVALLLYAEMLRSGYTAVGEFHYLAHAPDAQPYADPAEMAGRIVAAAADAGIGLTLLPAAYTRGGFDGAPLAGGQRRFRQGPDAARQVAETVARRHGGGQVAVGLAPHSLRAVTPDELRAALDGLDPAWPVHIHAAEQLREVEQCVAALGARPVEWLLDHAPIDARWCLIHATHMTEGETARLARSRAVAGLCPTTEGNLGDGVFPARAFAAAGGRWGIGSDSHVAVSPAEELRWLEYNQRLLTHGRAVLASGRHPSTGRALYEAALDAGPALGRPIGRIAPGFRADLVVLDPDAPGLAARRGDALLDGWVFAPGPAPVRDVMVGGRWVVRDGAHPAEARAREGFRRVLERLLG